MSNLYRRKGFFARVDIPHQEEVRDGVIEIAVLEARLSAIDVEALPGTRFSEERTRRFIASQQAVGSALRPDAIQAGMRNLNDLPGVGVTGVLQPGAAIGDVRISISIS